MFVLFYDGKYFHTLLIFDELFLNQLQKTGTEVQWNKGLLGTFQLGLVKTPHSITCNVFSSVLTKAFIQVSSMLVAKAK